MDEEKLLLAKLAKLNYLNNLPIKKINNDNNNNNNNNKHGENNNNNNSNNNLVMMMNSVNTTLMTDVDICTRQEMEDIPETPLERYELLTEWRKKAKFLLKETQELSQIGTVDSLNTHLLHEYFVRHGVSGPECEQLIFARQEEIEKDGRKRAVSIANTPLSLSSLAKLREKKKDKRRSMIAAQYIRDTLSHETPVEPGISKWRNYCAGVSTSHWFNNFYIVVVIIHMTMLAAEPPTAARLNYGVLLFELFGIILFYWIDIIFRFLRQGLKQDIHHIFIIIIVIIMTIDVLVSLGYSVNNNENNNNNNNNNKNNDNRASLEFSRFLRPFLLILHVKRLRNVADVLFRSFINMLGLLFFFLIFVSMFTLMGVMLLRGRYAYNEPTCIDCKYWDSATQQCHNCYFDHFRQGLLTMFILIFRDNYERLVIPAYHEISPFITFYFVLYIILMVYIGLNIVLAIVLHTAKLWRINRVLNEYVDERRALFAAFHMMDDKDKGLVSYHSCLMMLAHLIPEADVRSIEKLFMALDTNHDLYIDLPQFYDLCDVLFLRYHRLQTGFSLKSFILDIFEKHRIWKVNIKHLTFASKIRKHWLLPSIHFWATVICIVFLCAIPDSSPQSIKWTYGISFATLILRVTIDLFLICYEGFSPFFASSRWRIFDAIILWISFVTQTILAASFGFQFSLATRTEVIAWTLTCWRFLLFISLSKGFQTFVETVLHLGQQILDILVFLLSLFYVYVVWGLVIFRDGNNNNPTTHYADYSTGFSSAGKAFATLFQVLFSRSWSPYMYEQMEILNNGWICLYFVTFQVFLVIVGVNLFSALIVDTFLLQQENAISEVDELQNILDGKRKKKKNYDSVSDHIIQIITDAAEMLFSFFGKNNNAVGTFSDHATMTAASSNANPTTAATSTTTSGIPSSTSTVSMTEMKSLNNLASAVNSPNNNQTQTHTQTPQRLKVWLQRNGKYLMKQEELIKVQARVRGHLIRRKRDVIKAQKLEEKRLYNIEKAKKIAAAIKIQSLWRMHLAKKKVKKMVKSRRMRDQVAKELLSTERNYVSSLEIVVIKFLRPLSEDTRFEKNVIRNIFSEIEMIMNFNKTVILAELEKRMEKYDPLNTKLGDVFESLTDFLRASYTQYVNNYDNSAATFKMMMSNDSNFAQFIKDIESQPECKGLTLAAFLIMPIQRLPRYKLLLEELVKNTSEDHKDYKSLVKALEKVGKVAMHVNEKKRVQEGLGRLLEIQTTLIMSGSVKLEEDIVAPGRTLVKEGSVKDDDGNEEYLILLSDLLLVTKRSETKSSGNIGGGGGGKSARVTNQGHKYKYKLLAYFRHHDIVEIGLTPNLMTAAFTVGTLASTCTFMSPDSSQWVDAINSAVKLIRSRVNQVQFKQ